MNQERAIPNPASRLAHFRVERLRTGVQSIGARSEAFREEVDTALTSEGDRKVEDGTSMRSVVRAFGAAYLALSEALDAARASDVVSGPALDALEAIMADLKHEYANGVADLRKNVRRLGHREEFGGFCATAADKIGKLEQFWQTTYENVPQMKMRA